MQDGAQKWVEQYGKKYGFSTTEEVL